MILMDTDFSKTVRPKDLEQNPLRFSSASKYLLSTYYVPGTM